MPDRRPARKSADSWGGTVAERRMPPQLLQLPPDVPAFLGAPVAQGAGEARVDDVVAAAHQRRQEAPGELVPALRARFEAGQAFAQAVVDAPVVTGLEMQAGMQLDGAPGSEERRVGKEGRTLGTQKHAKRGQ